MDDFQESQVITFPSRFTDPLYLIRKSKFHIKVAIKGSHIIYSSWSEKRQMPLETQTLAGVVSCLLVKLGVMHRKEKDEFQIT